MSSKKPRVGPGGWGQSCVPILVGTLLLAGCPAPEGERIRLGVDATLFELGVVETLVAAAEQESPLRFEVAYRDADVLERLARKGKLDLVLVGAQDVAESLVREGLAARSEVAFHEELIMVGPQRDWLGRHGGVGAVELLKNISRTRHRYLLGRPGSVERAQHIRLFRAGRDAAEPGSFLETELEGAALVKEVARSGSFGLVKRSSLLLAKAEGRLAGLRVVREGDPSLVLAFHVLEIHASRTERPAMSAGAFDFFAGSEAKRIVGRAGVDRAGVPLLAAGAPDAGQGAKLDVGIETEAVSLASHR